LKRFDKTKTLVPGPGAYNDPRNCFVAASRLKSLKKTPFAQSSVRFESDNILKVRSAPGPGQYRIPGFAEENLRKSIIDAKRKPAFGQSAVRKFDLADRDTVAKPGPAQYQIKEKPFKPKRENVSASFASQTKQRELQYEDTPGPTAYDVPRAYDHLINVRREAPRTRNALKRQTSFNFVSKRDFNLCHNHEIPGPGAYDLAASTLHSGSHVAKLTDKRWKEEKNDIPGPGQYELSPMYQDTILKGTFNASLNNPLIPKEPKQSQKNTTNEKNINKFSVGNLEKFD
jgi:hypothetical protein